MPSVLTFPTAAAPALAAPRGAGTPSRWRRFTCVCAAAAIGAVCADVAARAGTCTQAAAVSAGEVDDFEAGIEDWSGHAPSISNPADGGEAGSGDAFLRVVSSGVPGNSGGKLVLRNLCQWTGNYSPGLGGAVTIALRVNNLGATDLSLRLGIRNAGGDAYVSAPPIVLTSLSGWQQISFTLSEAEMACANDGFTCGPFADVVGAVSELRLLHALGTTFGPAAPEIAAELGVDDVTITALPVELQRFDAD